MYGISFLFVTFVGSTGNKFFPPDFCQSEKERLLNVVIPTLPRFLPWVLALSASFIFLYWSFVIPEACAKIEKTEAVRFQKHSTSHRKRPTHHLRTYSIVIRLPLETPISDEPVKADPEKAVALANQSATSIAETDFISIFRIAARAIGFFPC